MSGVGLDVGTSFLIAARQTDEGIMFREHRDAFFRIQPSSPIASKMIEKGLQGLTYFKEDSGDFVLIGQDAIAKAVERQLSARRPLHRGVISPTEKDALPVLKFILRELVGTPREKNEKLVYSIPAVPIDQEEDKFDTGYHEDVIGNFLKEIGYEPRALHEAEAVAYSELMNDSLTGLTISAGAGMQNIALMSNGESILNFAVTRSGDWIDSKAAIACHLPDSVIQVEKEAGGFDISESNQINEIHRAVAVYYKRLVTYVATNLAARLNSLDSLPKFSSAIPLVIAGGTSLANGFDKLFKQELEKVTLPFQISEVRLATDQLRAVARGCLLASTI